MFPIHRPNCKHEQNSKQRHFSCFISMLKVLNPQWNVERTTPCSQGKGKLVDHGFGSFKFHAKEPGVSGKFFRLQWGGGVDGTLNSKLVDGF